MSKGNKPTKNDKANKKPKKVKISKLPLSTKNNFGSDSAV